MEIRSISHTDPVMHHRADFIIGVWCKPSDDSTRVWEQLWCRRVAANRFELCCIPFFAYDLALLDEVETAPDGEKQYSVTRVVSPSGHYTFRVWFGSTDDPTVRENVHDEARRRGCLVKCHSANLTAIDAASPDEARSLADYLQQQEGAGRLVYETGRTSAGAA